jgi:hypothetical protein
MNNIDRFRNLEMIYCFVDPPAKSPRRPADLVRRLLYRTCNYMFLLPLNDSPRGPKFWAIKLGTSTGVPLLRSSHHYTCPFLSFCNYHLPLVPCGQSFPPSLGTVPLPQTRSWFLVHATHITHCGILPRKTCRLASMSAEISKAET